jgi:hypothetical protein
MSAAASVKTASADSPIHEVLAERWSPYAFRDKPVSQDELRSLFEAVQVWTEGGHRRVSVGGGWVGIAKVTSGPASARRSHP